MTIRELHTTYRVRTIDDNGLQGRQITSAGAAAPLIAAIPTSAGRLDDCPAEHFGVLTLNTKHRITAFKILSIGTLDAAIVHPRDVFRAAIEANAAAVIVFHNHPSGDPTPSTPDVELSSRLAAAGVLLGIDLIDHVIVGHDGRYCSLRERGQL